MLTLPVAVSASSGSDMTKVLDNYHKKNYTKAASYNNKLATYANESCVKKMSSSMKNAYRNLLKGYQLESSKYSKRYLSQLYFSDIDNDKNAEMLVVFGSSEANALFRVYKYSGGKARRIAETSGGHSSFYAYPDHKGIIRLYGQMGYERIDKLTLSGKKIKTYKINSRNVGKGSYFPLHLKLTNYLKHDSKGKAYIDYSPLNIPATPGSNMDNLLKYYGKKDITKATYYNNKLSTYANESCVKKMSSKMKKAYRNLLKGYQLTSSKYSKRYLSQLYFSDIDNDKNAEMLVVFGSSEANALFRVYKYTGGKARRIAETSGGHSTFYAYPDRKGVIRLYGQMGNERIDKLSLNGKKIKTTKIGSRNIGKGSYFPLHQKLSNYLKYDSKGKAYIDYSLLK